ncbi:MAG TPA: general stress protein [Armatimonadota bacterium]|nr:general stress protein [Armatimonadota bacterium]
MADIVSAVFDDAMDAQRAVDWLRDNGVPQDAISVASRESDRYHATGDMADEDEPAAVGASDAGKGALAGAGIGAGVGALFGLAAAAIPGIGPFITAGALASALGTTAGAAVSGAIVGATSGGLAGALSHWGLNETESRYYAGEVERGGTYVGVDLERTGLGREVVMDAFRRYDGRFAGTV